MKWRRWMTCWRLEAADGAKLAVVAKDNGRAWDVWLATGRKGRFRLLRDAKAWAVAEFDD